MNNSPIKKKCNLNRWTGILLLCLALTLTIVGVVRWPILVYGASPCYFCAIILLLRSWCEKKQNESVPFDPFDPTNVLEMVF